MAILSETWAGLSKYQRREKVGNILDKLDLCRDCIIRTEKQVFNPPIIPVVALIFVSIGYDDLQHLHFLFHSPHHLAD